MNMFGAGSTDTEAYCGLQVMPGHLFKTALSVNYLSGLLYCCCCCCCRTAQAGRR